MSKHTPGPWSVFVPNLIGQGQTYGIDGPDEDKPAVVFFGSTEIEGIRKIEDARLIASAPEMLEMLREFSERAYNPFEPDNQSELYIRSQAIIAKATGAE